jgi:hypothetical protein
VGGRKGSRALYIGNEEFEVGKFQTTLSKQFTT